MDRRTVKFGEDDVSKIVNVMPSFVSNISKITTANPIGTEGNSISSSRMTDFRGIEQSLGFCAENAVELSRNAAYNQMKSSNPILSTNIQFDALNKTLALPKDMHLNPISTSIPQRENWEESNPLDASPQTDTSTDDMDEKNQRFERNQLTVGGGSDSTNTSSEKSGNQKTLRRLAQNREAARKSRLRKKAYVHQLESSRLKLTQLEQELQRARQQGIFISASGDQSHSISGNGGALAFDAEYSRWLEEQNRLVNELRTGVNSHVGNAELRIIVDEVTAHFDDLYRLKGIAAKTDVFHILSGMWKTPAERCFMWIGGFRSSELLKLLVSQLEPLTEQQVVDIWNLQQSSQQAEDALSQGMEALQQSLAETLASGSPASSASSGNVANYMGQMAMAMGQLGTLEGFLHQADNLRQQTLQQMHRILTIRQSARAILAISDYFSRLRALSSLWLARPRE